MKHGHLERSWQEGDCAGGSLEIVAELPSTSGEFKAVVSGAVGSTLRVCIYRHFYDEAVDECYWSQISAPSLTDALETAMSLAREDLARVSGETTQSSNQAMQRTAPRSDA
jgi:hypothetical protein